MWEARWFSRIRDDFQWDAIRKDVAFKIHIRHVNAASFVQSLLMCGGVLS